MGKISTKLEINIEIDVVYNNLKNRYNSERFKKAIYNCFIKKLIPSFN